MDNISLCCAACVAGGFGDPTWLSNDLDEGWVAQAMAATSFTFRTEAPETVSTVDGFQLDDARVSLRGRATDHIGLYAAVRGSTSAGIGNSEAYADVTPFDGFTIRAGRWLQQWGPVSGRRVEDRCFADIPLAMERFTGASGLTDTGLEISYRIPIKSFPMLIAAAVTHGQTGASFGQPPESGEGADVFSRLLYTVRLAANVGALFDGYLLVGGLFATGLNDTGPDNRTDILGGFVSGLFPAGPVRLGVNLEFLMRRLSIPKALHTEGGLSGDIVVGWKGLEAGLRVDLLGLPVPPSRDELQYRVAVAAGWAFTDQTRFRLQYAARNDNTEANTGHELVLQAIVGFDTRFGGQAPPLPKAASPRPQAVTPPAPIPPKQPKPSAVPIPSRPEGQNPGDWMVAASSDLKTARTLGASGEFANSAFHSQQSALKALQAVSLKRGVSPKKARDRSAIGAAEALARAGDPPPGNVWIAARELDRHFTLSRYPSELGGAPARYYDRATADRAVGHAETIGRWARSALTPPPPKPVAPPPQDPPEKKPEPAPTSPPTD